MSRAAFPTPYAGTYYPLYNSGVKQYIPPTSSMPFKRVSALFAAFAHAYPVPGGKGAQLLLERGQPDQSNRLEGLIAFARAANPGIKILISLGWGHNDWTYISDDHTSGTHYFPESVKQLVRKYKLDGFDIDDESIGGTSGTITQPDFDAVVRRLRNTLDEAGRIDKKPYYLTITPAGGVAHVSKENMDCFDLINAQCYGGSYPHHFTDLGYPRNQVAWGIDSEPGTPLFPTPPDYKGLAGIFNWSLSADSAHQFRYTVRIADAVGYPKKAKEVHESREEPAEAAVSIAAS